MDYNQPAPFAIQIELTKGCNLQCGFCGINGFQERPNQSFSFMSTQTAKALADQIRDAEWTSRIEFAMHGEPTMNQQWLDIISIFRDRLSNQLMVTTNGGGIVKTNAIHSTISQFFANGGDKLVIDEYERINFAEKIRRAIDVLELEENGVNVYEYPRQPQGNPHRRNKDRFICFIAPINLNSKGTHASLGNHCGSGGDIDLTVNQRCAKPFRELSVCWDGSINLCCNDFIGEFTAGDICLEDISEIWNNKFFKSARKFLMVPDRNALRPCRGCSHKSYRNGLLPDQKGKVDLDAPNETDKANVLEALQGGPDRSPTQRAKSNIMPILNSEELRNWE